MFKHWLEIVHNHDNGYLDLLQNIFALRESASIMTGSGKDSHLTNSLKVYSLNS